VPAELRPLVEARLTQWNILPATLQQQVLQDDNTLDIAAQLAAIPTTQRSNLLSALPSQRRAEVEGSFQKWLQLSDAQRRLLSERVSRYFDLTAEEKQKVLSTLSEAERSQMETTLREFEKLAPAQRVRCINAFGTFASFTPEERQQFLKNAERWQAMTPDQRQAWRKLVQAAPVLPPLPPGAENARPPLPPGAAIPIIPPLATNHN
jgi:CHAD domain-containing protein